MEFFGKDGGESRGIVDLLAIRKDHRSPPTGLKRGDLFEIVLVQIKGGSARWPTRSDILRLRQVARHYHAKTASASSIVGDHRPVRTVQATRIEMPSGVATLVTAQNPHRKGRTCRKKKDWTLLLRSSWRRSA